MLRRFAVDDDDVTREMTLLVAEETELSTPLQQSAAAAEAFAVREDLLQCRPICRVL